jgi:hypothetical protein
MALVRWSQLDRSQPDTTNMNLSRKLVFKLDSILNDRPERLCERADTVTLSGHSSRLQLCGRGASRVRAPHL